MMCSQQSTLEGHLPPISRGGLFSNPLISSCPNNNDCGSGGGGSSTTSSSHCLKRARSRSVDFGCLSMLSQMGEDESPTTTKKESKYNFFTSSKDTYFDEGLQPRIVKDVYPSSSKCCSQDDGEIGIATSRGSPARRCRGISGRDTDDIPNAASLRNTETATFMMRIPYGSTLNIGKLSVFILLLVTVVDFCVSQVHRIDSHEYYDALSAEVIRPAFPYKPAATHPLQRSSLGSAAISSVTEALSPILPFAGGLDLRREDYWAKSRTWLENIQSVAGQVRDAFSRREDDEEESKASPILVPRGGAKAPTKNLKKRSVKHVSAISAPTPFLSVEEIAEMTLGDVSDAFRYAFECNKEDFNESRFLNGMVPRVKKAVSAIKKVVEKSRGAKAKLSIAQPDAVGQSDALAFSAAMRVFAEWRVLRQVPDGYKGYAVGMSLGHKDIVQNLAKIEQGAQDYIAHQQEALSPQELRSPTIRELLNYEIDMGINPVEKLPRLAEKSAAMGFLWVRRQLHYQTLIFENVMKIPDKFATTAEAVTAAYEEVYDRFHGWAVQKIFNYSFKSAPEAEKIYRHMNPHRLEEVMQSAQKLEPHPNGEEKRPSVLASSVYEIEKEDNPFISFFKHIGSEWDKAASHIGSEWDKAASHVGKIIFAKNHGSKLSVRGGSDADPDLQQSVIENFVTQEMVKDAHENIRSYLKVALPMLDDLSVLFDDLNMNDPTKV